MVLAISFISIEQVSYNHVHTYIQPVLSLATAS